jgi:hypothetical protein
MIGDPAAVGTVIQVREVSSTIFWLAFLVGAWALGVTYLLQAPISLGNSLLRIGGCGAAAGVIIGSAALLLFWRVRQPRGLFAVGKYVLLATFSGALGGAGGALLLDRHEIVESQLVELPLLGIEHVPHRRGRDETQLTTLQPVNPTQEARISFWVARGRAKPVRPGMCIEARVEKGQFGGHWISELAAVSCSQLRGKPSTHVIVFDDFSSWRWHTPKIAAEGHRRTFDDALSPDLQCRVRPGSWLYRCSPTG